MQPHQAAGNYPDTPANGRVTGARLRDLISGQEYSVHATNIVNATGPWADAVISASGIATPRMIGGVRGSHLVLPRFTGAPEQAIYTEAVDGRPIFVIPWNGQLLVGTSEVADSNTPDNPQPSAGECDYLFQSFARLFPRSGLSPADIRYDVCRGSVRFLSLRESVLLRSRASTSA